MYPEKARCPFVDHSLQGNPPYYSASAHTKSGMDLISSVNAYEEYVASVWY